MYFIIIINQKRNSLPVGNAFSASIINIYFQLSNYRIKQIFTVGDGMNMVVVVLVVMNQLKNHHQSIIFQYIKFIQKKVVKIAISSFHSLVITDDGSIYGWGCNKDGQLSLKVHDTGNIYNKPILLPLLCRINVTQISCGLNHSIALSENNTLYSWGNNKYYQLGRTTDLFYDNNVMPIIFNNTIKYITSGSFNNFIITNNNKIYSFGRNEYGECGFNPRDSTIKQPRLIDFSIKVEDISSADYHTLILTSNGDVYSFGSGKYGRLGNKSDLSTYKPYHIQFKNKIIFINAGGASSLCITDENDLYCWGYNHYGQLGLGHDVDCNIPMKVSGNGINELKIIKASMGEEHCIAISSNGNIVYYYL